MEENQEIMERTGKIIRRSIYTFLKDFHFFINTPVIILLPFSASVLLYQSCFYDLEHLNLHQLIFSSVFNLPIALSSLVIAKASIIQHLDHHKHTILSLYKPLAITYLCNIVLTLATLFILRVASNCVEELLWLSSSKNQVFSMAAMGVYYVVLTNTMVICNLGLIMAGMNKGMGYKAIYRAYLVRKSTSSMALWLALPINLGVFAVQFLFRYRIVRGDDHERSVVCMVIEGLLIACMFSVLIVIDTIASCLFIKRCELDFEREERGEVCDVEIDFVKEDNGNSCRLQNFDEVL